jgi:hypothetical protein
MRCQSRALSVARAQICDHLFHSIEWFSGLVIHCVVVLVSRISVKELCGEIDSCLEQDTRDKTQGPAEFLAQILIAKRSRRLDDGTLLDTLRVLSGCAFDFRPYCGN